MAVVEAMQASLVATDQTQVLTALSRMAVVAVARVNQVGALALQVVALVKTQLLRLVHLHRDLPEQQDQVQMLQLAPVVVAAQVQLEFVDSFIRNTRVLNAPRVATVVTDFLIQSLELRRITAVAAVAVQITTPAQLSNLGVADLVAAAMVPTTIV